MMRNATGGELAATVDHPAHSPAPPDATSTDWFVVQVYEWMWREDGLGLRPGAELMVYATIYQASAHGGGTFVATNVSVGVVLGYPRETVSRAVNKLLRSGLVWVVGHIRDDRIGKSVRCFAVCQPAIDRVQSRMSARHLLGYLAPAGTVSPLAKAVPDVVPANAESLADGTVTKRHGTSKESVDGFRQSVTKRHADPSSYDETSRGERDAASHVTKRHGTQNDVPPAVSSLFDKPLINTYYLSTNQGATKGVESPTVDVDTATATLADTFGATISGMDPTDLSAFRTLLDHSVRPVDASYVGKNLTAFRALIAEGITADVILEAYEAYADYQRRMLAEHGENRPMHLLKWLRQRPNSNIQYVLNARDERWRHERSSKARRDATGSRQPRPSHENPRLERLVERGTHLWFVTDERGSRFVDRSRGVESHAQALALYEQMYRDETPDR